MEIISVTGVHYLTGRYQDLATYNRTVGIALKGKFRILNVGPHFPKCFRFLETLLNLKKNPTYFCVCV